MACLGGDTLKRHIQRTLYLGKRIEQAIARIRQFAPAEGYHLADSGGKDSSIVIALADMAGVKYDSHFAFTTVDPPELLRFLKAHHPFTEWHRPAKSMWQLIIQKGIPPSRRVRYCCELLKERLGTGRVVLTGIRWAESRNRVGRGMVHPCIKDKTKIFVNPIIDWSADEVWEFSARYDVPYCSLYDEGFDRIGCVMCPLQSYNSRRREAKRWPGFYKAYMRTFEKMLQARIDRGKPASWQNAEEVMEWFLSRGCEKKDQNEATLPLFA